MRKSRYPLLEGLSRHSQAKSKEGRGEDFCFAPFLRLFAAMQGFQKNSNKA
jgi:hypothetical protein